MSDASPLRSKSDLIISSNVVNPAGASVRGWVQEIRSSALYFILIVPLSFVVMNKQKDLNYFLILIIIISAAGTFYGMRQLFVGLTSGEKQFLDKLLFF